MFEFQTLKGFMFDDQRCWKFSWPFLAYEDGPFCESGQTDPWWDKSETSEQSEDVCNGPRRTVRPEPTRSWRSTSHFPCPKSLGGTALLSNEVTPFGYSHPFQNPIHQCPLTLRSNEIVHWPLQIENVDSAIDWRIEFISRRVTPLNSIRKSILDLWSGNLSLHS